MAIYNGNDNLALQLLLKGDKGTDGKDGKDGKDGLSVFVRYSAFADGTDFTETWSNGQNYVGLVTASTAPEDKGAYQWVKLNSVQGDFLTPEVADNRYLTAEVADNRYAFKSVKSLAWGSLDENKLIYACKLSGNITIRDLSSNTTTSVTPSALSHCKVEFIHPCSYDRYALHSCGFLYLEGQTTDYQTVSYCFYIHSNIFNTSTFNAFGLGDNKKYQIKAENITEWLQECDDPYTSNVLDELHEYAQNLVSGVIDNE